MFIVRSGPILAESDKNRRTDVLRIAGYHPAAEKVTVSGGGVYFIIVLGRFWDLSLAVDLLMKLKQIDPIFLWSAHANRARRAQHRSATG